MKRNSDQLPERALRERSPSGALIVGTSDRTGIEVELDDTKRSDHDEVSLAEDLESVMFAFQRRYAEYLGLAAERVMQSESESYAEESSGARAFRAAIEDVCCKGTSVDGTVEVTVASDGDFFAKFNSNVVRRVDFETRLLESGINEALADAMRKYSIQVRGIRAHLRADTIKLICVRLI